MLALLSTPSNDFDQFPIDLAAMTWPATWRPLAHARCAWWRQRQKDQRSELSVLYLFCALRFNYNDVEMTLLTANQPVNNLHIVGIYRSTSKVRITRFIDALKHLHSAVLNDPNAPVIIFGDFNVNLNENTSDKNTLCKYLMEEKHYVQVINQFTTDYKTQIDHIHTNIPERLKNCGVLESYFSDHKPIFASLI